MSTMPFSGFKAIAPVVSVSPMFTFKPLSIPALRRSIASTPSTYELIVWNDVGDLIFSRRQNSLCGTAHSVAYELSRDFARQNFHAAEVWKNGDLIARIIED